MNDSTDLFSQWDYSQSVDPNSAMFDSWSALPSNDLPFQTTSDWVNNTTQPQVVTQPKSSFWGSLGSTAGSLFGTITGVAQAAAPAIVASALGSKADPDPNAAGKTQQTTAQKTAAQNGNSYLPWIIGGVIAFAVGAAMFFGLRKRKG